MSEGTTSDNVIGQWFERSYPSRILFAGAMLRFAGLLGAAYCAVLILGLAYSWLGWKLFGLDGVYPLFGPRVIGYGLDMVLFLLAYAAGAVLPVLIRSERSNAGKE